MKMVATACTLAGSLAAGLVSAAEYKPTWESLKTAPVPEWIMDAKLGIYTHWGVYSVPAYKKNTYGREMYTSWQNDAKAEGIRKYHEENYGSIFEFGYKDFVPLFTAPEFDPAEWAEVMKSGGVKFAGICLVHHDGFCLWDSKFTRWNSMDMGPKRDIYGELAREIRGRDMHLLATFHHARTYGHHLSRAKHAGFTPEEKKKLDIYDPRYDDLYRNPETVTKEKFGTEWQNKINEVIRKYQPDAIWFDGMTSGLKNGTINEKELLKCFSNYYNAGTPYVNNPIIMNKLPSGKVWNYPVGFGLRCYENGRDMEKDVRGDWLIDRAIGYPWTYVKNKQYGRGSSYHIVSIVDITARGGVMLLSLTPKGDGSIPDEEIRIMREIGEWLKVNGEGIYATRPWKKVAEGIDADQLRTENPDKKRPGQTKASWGFETLEKSKGTAVRFTRNKDFTKLYAFIIGKPQNGTVTIKTLAKGNVDKQNKGIASVDLLGSNAPVTWKQTSDELKITFPEQLPCKVAWGFRITTKSGRIDDSPREVFDDPIPRKGDWPIFNSER